MLTLYVVMKTVQNNIKEPNKTVWNLHGTSSTFPEPPTDTYLHLFNLRFSPGCAVIFTVPKANLFLI